MSNSKLNIAVILLILLITGCSDTAVTEADNEKQSEETLTQLGKMQVADPCTDSLSTLNHGSGELLLIICELDLGDEDYVHTSVDFDVKDLLLGSAKSGISDGNPNSCHTSANAVGFIDRSEPGSNDCHVGDMLYHRTYMVTVDNGGESSTVKDIAIIRSNITGTPSSDPDVMIRFYMPSGYVQSSYSFHDSLYVYVPPASLKASDISSFGSGYIDSNGDFVDTGSFQTYSLDWSIYTSNLGGWGIPAPGEGDVDLVGVEGANDTIQVFDVKF